MIMIRVGMVGVGASGEEHLRREPPKSVPSLDHSRGDEILLGNFLIQIDPEPRLFRQRPAAVRQLGLRPYQVTAQERRIKIWMEEFCVRAIRNCRREVPCRRYGKTCFP